MERSLTELPELFSLKLPFKDGEWWNGKPDKWSNLSKYKISYTQRFGGNASYYAKYGMIGHNGNDFGCIIGTPIVAPCKIYVEWTQLDSDGYGNNIFAETEVKKVFV